jgi:hypothetical protein
MRVSGSVKEKRSKKYARIYDVYGLEVLDVLVSAACKVWPACFPRILILSQGCVVVEQIAGIAVEAVTFSVIAS